MERRRYNEAVREYNTAVTRFPGSLVASLRGFSARRYFEASPGADASLAHVATPEQIVLAGKETGERVLVYDCEGYFMGVSLAERLALDLPEDREFATAAGYVLYMLKHLPVEGEHFADQGWRFEVVDMDGRKIDKLLVSEAEA